MRRTGTVMAGLVLVTVALGACGGGGSSTESSGADAVSVDARTETFVDTKRSRTLDTPIFVPGGEKPAAGRPLVVFAHGSGGNPDFYKVLLEAWAGSGYVVAAPRMPPDTANQPGDVSFVIDELLRLSGTAGGPYAGLIDAGRIGVAGHSAGGRTVLGVGFNTCCVDRRVRAGVVLAGDSPPFPGGA